MKYADMLNKISKIIEKSKDRNWIVVGDNSSGKSELLRIIVDKLKPDIYYIDSVNRYFKISNTNLAKDKVDYRISRIEIVDQRLESGFYNLVDSFGKTDHIERLYPLYKEKLKELLKEFLDIDFNIEREMLEEGFGYGDIKVRIDNEEVELSSGYQAIVRIFAELIFYSEYLKGKGLVVIDEVDEFLSPKHSSRILNFLTEKFPSNSFMISTHSSDLVANSNECNIIALSQDNFSVLDSNDFTSLTEVNTLFDKLFSYDKKNKKNLIDDQLQRLLDLKIIDSWTEEEKNEFKEIDFTELTPVQKLIYKQIREW